MSRSSKRHSFLKGFLIFIIVISLLITGSVILLSQTSLKEVVLEKFKISNLSLSQQIDINEDVKKVEFKVENQTVIQESQKADNSYFDDVLFIGDSRTVGLVKLGFVDSSNVLAEVGLAHTNALDTSFDQDYKSYTIEEYLERNSPRVIMIGFGINGLSYMNESEFMDEYSNLVDTVMEYSPNSKIIIESILPIGETLEYKDDRYSNEKVKSYNELLYKMCEEKGIYYMDLYSCVIDENTGYLNEEYDSGDGLHFNKTAYEQITDYMLRHTV